MIAGPQPPIPDDFELVVWFDLSPLRPAEFWNMEARHWMEADRLQEAYRRGVKRARDEATAIQALDEMDDDDD